MKRGLCLIKIGDGFTNQLAALLNKSGENLEMNKQIPLEIGRYHCLFYKYAKGLVLNGVCLDVREGDKYIGKPSIKEYFKYSTALLNQKMEKNKITLVPKIGTIFYDETIDNTVILSKVTNELNRPPILTFCTLQNPNAIERFCYSFDMSSENESRLRRLYVNGFNKSLIPQEVTRDNVKVNDPLIGDWGLVFVMGLLTTVAVCVDTRGFVRLCRLGNNQLFKRDDIIPSNYLKNVLYRASFMYRRKSKLINISTEKAYELYSSDKYDNDTQGIKELAFTSLRNACKIQLKRNLVFGKKLDLSSLEFINCVNNNIELVNHHGAQ